MKSDNITQKFAEYDKIRALSELYSTYLKDS